jgi:hypothetical protein
MVELQESNKVLGNLLVHNKPHVNWLGIENLLLEFPLLHLCFIRVYFASMY